MSYLWNASGSYSIMNPQNGYSVVPFNPPDPVGYRPMPQPTGYSTLPANAPYDEQHAEQEVPAQDMSILVLRPAAAPTQFTGMIDELISDVQQLVKSIISSPLPYDLSITLCRGEEFKKHYEARAEKNRWHQGIRGFSLHGAPKEIFVLRDTLEQTLLTLGHEIGHILTPPAVNALTEEAKAYAFEILFLEAMQRRNTKGIKDRIDLSALGTPAANGVHNVALQWVNSFLMDGRSAKDIYDGIIHGDIIICED